jgi:hypothetical protein
MRTIQWGVTLAVLLLWPGPRPELAAQAARAGSLWVVPVEHSQGPVFGRGTPNPYTASLRAHLGRGFGEGGAFRIGPTIAMLYANPSWEAAAGARATLRVRSLNIAMLSGWGVYLQVEQLYGTGEVSPLSVGTLLDLGILRVGLAGSHDWRREVQTVEASVGVGLHALLPLLRPVPPREPDFGPPPPTERRDP